VLKFQYGGALDNVTATGKKINHTYLPANDTKLLWQCIWKGINNICCV